MNEKLEAFRTRLRGREKEKFKFTWQFLIGSPVAWLAFLISSATAFSSIVYHSDKLSVQVAEPAAYEDESGDQVYVVLPPGITFINSGTRPIAVVRASIYFVQPRQKAEHVDCLHGQVDVAWLPLEMLVVKPYDILVYALQYDGKKWPRELYLARSELNKNNPSHMPLFVSCATFQIVAADTTSFYKTVEIGRTDEHGLVLSRGDPRHLIKRSMFWTSVIGADLEVSADLVEGVKRQGARKANMQPFDTD
jgi:hypothetical protein